jgi:hypothetical protein
MKSHVRYGIKSLCLGLTFAIVFQFAVPPAQAQNPPAELNIVVVEGEGAINNARQRATREPIVQIEDENHKPIAGAAVVFTLPTEGATGEFAKGLKSITVVTDSQGRATAQGLKLHEYPGKLPIHVTASYRGLTARTTINQSVEGPPVAAKAAGGSGKLIAILAIAGAAAAGGAVFALRKNNNTSSAVTPPPVVTPIGITPGAGTITGPH